jgi:hypothetical protein
MFGIQPYSTQPFSMTGEVRIVFDMGFLNDTAFTFAIYVSSIAGYATRPSDALPSQPFRGVLQSYSFDRSILQSDIGQFSTSGGSLVISNQDAFYDFLPIDYTIDARPVNIKLSRTDKSYDDAYTLARVTSTGWNITVDAVTIDLIDYGYKIDVPMQVQTYLGTGGLEGTADLMGKRLPLVFGFARDISPVNLIPPLLIRQVCSEQVEDIVNVYDRGAALTKGANYSTYAALVAASVPPSSYVTCKELGLFKMGSEPSGTVTADVKGINSGGYITTTADIVRWAVLNRTQLLANINLSEKTFDEVNAEQSAPIDCYLNPDDGTTVAVFVQELMTGIGGWGGFFRNGLFYVRLFKGPANLPLASFSRKDMFGGDIQKEPLPSNYRPPPWRWRIPYAKCWTVQTDLAGVVAQDHKSFVAQEYRLAEASNNAILVDHPFAQDGQPPKSFFSNLVDAQAEADRRLQLFRFAKAIYRATFPRRMLQFEIGDEIFIQHERFDLIFGRPMIIVEMRENLNFANTTSLDVVEVALYG